MTLFLLSLLTTTPHAWAAPPQSIEVDYTLKYDLDATGDQLCPITQICDCSASYKGTGKQVEVEGNRFTFEGTWTVRKSDCDDNLSIWVPADGKAFHTVRRDAEGKVLLEWLTHQSRSQTTRLQSGMKAAGQYWVADINAVWNGEAQTVTHSEKENGSMTIFKVITHHELTWVFK